MNQRTATCNALIAVLSARGVDYELGGEKIIKDVLTKKDIETVQDVVFAGFRKGEIEMSADSKAKYAEDKELKKYVSGLVNNWIRKAPEFNNDQAYVAKNPGSRAGSQDEQVKNMKALLAQTTDATHRKMIQDALDARIAEIKPTKSVEIDASKLPDSLKHLVK
jgi:hypothetical protein